MDKILYAITDTMDTLRQTFLRCLATFLIWFSIVFGCGFALLICTAIFNYWFL